MKTHCEVQTERKKADGIDNSKHFGKGLNTQSLSSIVFCSYVKVKYPNILTNFLVITNTTKRFCCSLRLDKKSVPLKNKLPPPKEKQTENMRRAE